MRLCLVLALTFVAPACGSRDHGDVRRTPVLLVHGLGETPAIWEPLRAAMLGAGWRAAWVHAVTLRPADGDVIEAGAQIRASADSLLARAALDAERAGATPPRRVAVVAHSLGALSSRWFATRLAPERVAMLVSVAGANHGSTVFCNWTGEAARQLCPALEADSSTSLPLAVLNGTRRHPVDETPFGPGADQPDRVRRPPEEGREIVYFAILAEREPWLEPASSAELDGTGGIRLDRLPGDERRRELRDGSWIIQGTDHDGIVRDRGAISLIINLLLARP